MRIQKPCSTSGLIAYSPGAIDNLWNNGNVAGSYSIAGVTRGDVNSEDIFDIEMHCCRHLLLDLPVSLES